MPEHRGRHARPHGNGGGGVASRRLPDAIGTGIGPGGMPADAPPYALKLAAGVLDCWEQHHIARGNAGPLELTSLLLDNRGQVLTFYGLVGPTNGITPILGELFHSVVKGHVGYAGQEQRWEKPTPIPPEAER